MPDLSPEHQRLIETVRMSPEPSAAIDALALKLARLERLERAREDVLPLAELVAKKAESGRVHTVGVPEQIAETLARALLAAREEEAT